MGLMKDTASIQSKSINKTPVDRLKISEQYGKLPLAFEINKGQLDPQVKFLCRGSGYTLFLTQAETVLMLRQPARRREVAKNSIVRGSDDKRSQLLASNSSILAAASNVIRMRLIGGNRLCKVEGLEKLPGVSNYFIGNDPSKWRTNVARYAKVKLKDVYPGIDMVYYGNQRQMEYDFVVKPGADPNAIHLAYEGAKETKIDGLGNLVLKAQGGEVVFRSPKVYQRTANGEKKLASHYVSRGSNQIGFELGEYDKTSPLVIDPVLDYSTYLGGNVFDGAWDIVVDSTGNAYITGVTASVNFPITSGAFQTAYAANQDAFVTKLNPTGTGLIYSTYLGGNGNDNSWIIFVDPSGFAYVSGQTSSNDFPTTPGAYQTVYGGGTEDGFFTKLNTTGTALIYSTYLGGSGEDNINQFTVDSGGNAYITGYTASTNFPTTPGAYQTTYGGGTQDAFVTELNPTGTGLLYSTYLGGNSGPECGCKIFVDSGGNAFITGYTASTNFPTTPGAYQTAYGGGARDAFVTKLNPAGTGLLCSTYLGGNADDFGYCVILDSNGNIYISGGTASPSFPTTPGAFQTVYGGGAHDGFLTGMNPALTGLVFSSYLGGNNEEWSEAIVINSSGNLFIAGGTTSTNFPTTTGAYQTAYGGGASDVFVSEFNFTGTGLLYSTFLGGNGGDWGEYIAVDSNDSIYLTGRTNSTNFPITAGAYQTSFAGGTDDGFVTKIDVSAFFTPTPTLTVTDTPMDTPTVTPAPTVCVDSVSTITAGTGGAINNTECVETDGAYIYVDEWGGNKVQVFRYSDSSPVTSYAVTSPIGMRIGPGGYLYVDSYLNNQVLVLDPLTGAAVATIGAGLLYHPRGMAFDASGNLYVTDYGNSRIIKFTFSGTAWSAAATIGAGIVGGVEGIAIDSSGNIYAGDTTYHRITVFDPDGSNPRYWGAGLFNQDIEDMRFDGNGMLWVSDRQNHRVLVFGTDGVVHDTLGPSFASLTLNNNIGLAFGANGDLFVAEAGNNRVDRITLCTPLPTATFTPTATETLADSPTPTPSATSTAIDTATAPNTPTGTFTSTRTVTPIPTSTPTPTWTSTPTPTRTPTPLPTPIPTNTPTLTPTGTPTLTFTRTPSFTPTHTPPATATPSATGTPSATPTRTGTLTSTATLTPSSTSSPTRSSTPTVTRTTTPSHTSTPSQTFTLVPTATATATPTHTYTAVPTSSPTRTNTPTSTGTSTRTPTATLPPGFEKFYVSKNVINPKQEPVSIFVATSKYGGHYSLNVYNSAGERVKNLDDRELTEPFQHSYLWDGTNQYGEKCASGMYVFYLAEPYGIRMARVLLIR
jgi:sugar lactone lactonase YvrE